MKTLRLIWRFRIKKSPLFWLLMVISLIPPLITLAQTSDVEPRYPIMEIGRGTAADFAWHPDGRMIAVGGSQGLWLYTASFDLIASFESSPITHLVWNPDGTHLISAQADGSVLEWTIQDENGVYTAQSSGIKSDETAVTTLAWSPNGQLLAVGQADGTILLWQDRRFTSIQAHQGAVSAFAWKNDAEYVSAGADRLLISSSGASWESDSVIRGLAWSPDGSWLAGAGDDLIIWETDQFQELYRLTDHPVQVNDVAWSGRFLASVSGDYFRGSELRLWDAITFTPISVLPGTAAFTRVISRPGSSQIAVGGLDNLIRTIQPDSGQVIAVLQGHLNAVDALAWSPDGGELASASEDGIIRLWQLDQPIASFQGHLSGVNALGWSPDGLMIASAGWDNTVRVWMRSSGKIRAVMLGHTDRVWAVAWNPDGSILASASRDGSLRLWNPYTGDLLQTMRAGIGELNTAVWSPDGTKIASSSDNGEVWVWDVATGAPLHVLSGHNRYVWSLVWEPHGSRLISASWFDGSIRVWDTDSGERVEALSSGSIQAIEWSPGGTYLATGGSDGTLRIWDLPDNGRVTQVLTHHKKAIYTLAWSPDGSQLASGGAEGVIFIWGQ